jgi:inner membrane protein
VVVASAGFRRLLGRRAALVGGLLGVVPDLDTVASWVVRADVTDAWLHHRGVTHSIPVALVYGAALGWAVWRIERLKREPLDVREDETRRSAWIWLGTLSCVTHPVIDLFTSYGTQLLAPFSKARFAIDALPIIDPLYSLPLLLAFLFALFTRTKAQAAQRLARLSLVYVLLYTLMAWGTGLSLEARIREQLRLELGGAAHGAEVTAYPILLQPFWRRIVVDLPDHILIGFVSPFDDRPVPWQQFARTDTHPAVQAALKTRSGEVFQWFAMGKLHWTLQAAPDGGYVVEARDYRYGLPNGSELGFWGLRFRLDAQLTPLAKPELLSERPTANGGSFRDLWNGLLGR